MEHVAFCDDVTEKGGVLRELHIAEADDFVTKRATFLRWCRPIDELSATAAGEDEAGRMARELQMLQVMVVPGDPEVDLVLAKECLPVANQNLLVPVDTV